MATEKRLIDANVLDEILKDFESRHKDHCFVLSAKAIAFTRQIVYAIKTVDAVEVVRCKDCKHYMAEEKERCEAMRSTPYGLCLKHRCLPLAGYHEYRNEDDFCSDGERRSET